MSQAETLHGLLAEFESADALVAAAHKAHAAGYRDMDAYTPFPVHGLSEALGYRRSWVPLTVLVCGLLGGLGGFAMQYYASVISYPLNIGGRPLNSWPAFMPITFELTVLCAAFGAVFGMLMMNGLPKPYNPLFNVPRFALASRDRFFLCIEATDAQFDRKATGDFLHELKPTEVSEVQP